jgi:hypothetical protein
MAVFFDQWLASLINLIIVKASSANFAHEFDWRK